MERQFTASHESGEAQFLGKAESINEVESQESLGKNCSENISVDNRAQFYNGEERLMLRSSALERVRELQEANDQLQRMQLKHQRELSSVADPFQLLSEIEHINIMIARNTGEILNLFAQNESRLKRISELEKLNEVIKEEMRVSQAKFVNAQNIDSRTKLAVEFFQLKSAYENNLDEISDLS